MLPSNSEIQYFVEVSRTLNISRAAERLGISQPTLSMAIRRLEDTLAVPLMVRGKSGIQLTRTGQKFARQAQALLESWEQLRNTALDDQTEIQGQYTVGCHPSVALYSLPEFLPRLCRENPKAEFRLVHDLSRRIAEDIISFKIDFGIVVNPPQHPDLVIRELFSDRVTLWCRKDGKTDMSVLICDPDLLQTQQIQRLIDRQGLRFDRTMTSSSLEVITALAASGTGVGVIPARVATRHRADELKQLGSKSPSVPDRICLVYRQDAQKSPASRRIAQAIERALSP